MARGLLVNDVHSRLTPTRVREIVRATSLEALAGTVRSARARGLRLCVAGGRHAMGGQAFAENAVLVDTPASTASAGSTPGRARWKWRRGSNGRPSSAAWPPGRWERSAR